MEAADFPVYPEPSRPIWCWLCPVLHGHSAVRLLKEKTDHSAKNLEGGPKILKSGGIAIVITAPGKSVRVEGFSAHPPAAWFAVCDRRKSVPVGVINATDLARSPGLPRRLRRLNECYASYLSP